jgi:hypothetical protein
MPITALRIFIDTQVIDGTPCQNIVHVRESLLAGFWGLVTSALFKTRRYVLDTLAPLVLVRPNALKQWRLLMPCRQITRDFRCC